MSGEDDSPDVDGPTAVDRACDAWRVLALAAADLPRSRLGGVLLRARPGPVRDACLAAFAEMAPADAPSRRAPAHVGRERLSGGLDVAATLAEGRPVQAPGLIEEAAGGWIVAPTAEAQTPDSITAFTAALDAAFDRTGPPTCLIAFDESGGAAEADRGVAPALADRLALHVDLEGLRVDDWLAAALDPEIAALAEAVAGARARDVTASEEVVAALTQMAAALGVGSMRAPLYAVRVARLAAALAGRTETLPEDAAVAARLVLGPRATRAPAPPEDEPSPPDAPDEPPPDEQETNEDATSEPPAIEDLVLEAVAAALPDGLLTEDGAAPRRGSASGGVAGVKRRSLERGRPIGARRGDPRTGARLDLVATLRTAAPWQPVRRRLSAAADASSDRLRIVKDDLRVKRFQQPSATLTIFVVDASGSAAFARLAEAKGAVELLLGESYVRRDEVALLAFRGQGEGPLAELLLPPTRSLTRVKRALAALPGGGGTPLAAGIDAAAELALQARRRGVSPTIVFLTDGRANIARDGAPGRAKATADATAAATRLRTEGVAAIVIDTSARPSPAAADLARAMGARHAPLPSADAATLSAAVRDTRESAGA